MDCNILAGMSRGRCKSCYAAWKWATDPDFRAKHHVAAKGFAERNPRYWNDKAIREKEKHQARTKVSEALAAGTLRKEPCVRCGREDAQAHHDDHGRPLDVVWLCPPHHGERHREIRRGP